MVFPKNIANAVSLCFFIYFFIYFFNVYFFYMHEDNGSVILNVFKTNKKLKHNAKSLGGPN